jgi:23S rRNA (cytosine1962-C5)-methyltransferase
MFHTLDRPVCAEDIQERMQQALALRRPLLSEAVDSCRLINTEGDFLPGLIVDKYNSGLCVQITTAGMEQFRDTILTFLKQACTPGFIYELSDNEAVEREGLAARNGCIHGELPEPLLIKEHGLTFCLELGEGQKTGFFLDQRQNRLLLRNFTAGASVCDCFCYSGGFSANAWAGGAAAVHAVDSSREAVALARENMGRNGFCADEAGFFCADVFTFLRTTTSRYNVIVLDPPKFAPHAADRERAARGYKDINLLAIKNVLPGGTIFTFSCSQAIDATLFSQIVFGAAADAGRQVQVLQRLCQPSDHPFNISHREGEYLKGVVLRVI